jgi:shikimate kinase
MGSGYVLCMFSADHGKTATAVEEADPESDERGKEPHTCGNNEVFFRVFVYIFFFDSHLPPWKYPEVNCSEFMKVRNIALIGFRATGKSAVGRILAQKLGRIFIDMDQLLVTSAGREIDCWVRLEGWQSFRRAESELIEALAFRQRLVVATGGGVVMAPGNREALKRGFFTIWLKAEMETIRSRILADPASESNRPPLSELPMDEEIRSLLSEREPLYAEAADVGIDTEGKTPYEIAEEIAAGLP